MFLFNFSCGNNEQSKNDDAIITVEQLYQKLNDGEEFYLLDVRTQEEFTEKRLAFAKDLIPYDSIELYLDRLPEDKNTKIYSFCRSGRRSGITTEYLISIGYVNALNVEGGIIAWQEAGFETTSGTE